VFKHGRDEIGNGNCLKEKGTRLKIVHPKKVTVSTRLQSSFMLAILMYDFGSESNIFDSLEIKSTAFYQNK
jgi:hypothetical protein